MKHNYLKKKTCLCNLAGHVLRLLISDWCLQTFPNDEELKKINLPTSQCDPCLSGNAVLSLNSSLLIMTQKPNRIK